MAQALYSMQLDRIAAALERIADALEDEAESNRWTRYEHGDGPKPR